VERVTCAQVRDDDARIEDDQRHSLRSFSERSWAKDAGEGAGIFLDRRASVGRLVSDAEHEATCTVDVDLELVACPETGTRDCPCKGLSREAASLGPSRDAPGLSGQPGYGG
jgi:hypothetical protein